MEQVTEGVFAETRIFGCNPGFIVTDEGVVMVDTPQKPSEWPRWKEAISRHGPVRWIINTEAHWDHVMGNPYFEGPIVAHEATLADFYKPSPLWGFGIDGVGAWIQKADPGGVDIAGDYKPRAPEVTFSDQLTLYVGGTEIRLLHTPGHIAGETAVYIPKRRVLFSSDNLFVDHLIWFQDADPVAWLESLARLKKLDVDRIVPGHGPVVGKEWIDRMEEKIRQVLGRVRNALHRRLSEEETVASVKYRDLCVLDEDYRNVHDQVEAISIRRIYRRLKEEE